MKDAYLVLGLTPGASDQEIRRAYRRLAMKCHPDRLETGDRKKFDAVQNAYETLTDPERRRQHDDVRKTAIIPDPQEAAHTLWEIFIRQTINH